MMDTDVPTNRQALPNSDFRGVYELPKKPPVKSVSGVNVSRSDYASSLRSWLGSYDDVPEFVDAARLAGIAAAVLSGEQLGSSYEKIAPVLPQALKSLYE